jgi:hypothetical protein
MIYFDMGIAQNMFIEPSGIEDVAAMWDIVQPWGIIMCSSMTW